MPRTDSVSTANTTPIAHTTHQVLNEVIAGDSLTPAQAAKRVPSRRGNRPTSPETVWRWATSGLRSPGGILVRLESCRIGRNWLTSTAALTRFFVAIQGTITPAADPPPTSPPPASTPHPTPKHQAERLAQIETELDQHGL